MKVNLQLTVFFFFIMCLKNAFDCYPQIGLPAPTDVNFSSATSSTHRPLNKSNKSISIANVFVNNTIHDLVPAADGDNDAYDDDEHVDDDESKFEHDPAEYGYVQDAHPHEEHHDHGHEHEAEDRQGHAQEEEHDVGHEQNRDRRGYAEGRGNGHGHGRQQKRTHRGGYDAAGQDVGFGEGYGYGGHDEYCEHCNHCNGCGHAPPREDAYESYYE